jgi:hypothetical protein
MDSTTPSEIARQQAAEVAAFSDSLREERANKPRIRPAGTRSRVWYCSGRGVEGRVSPSPVTAYWDWFWLCLRTIG